MKKVNVHLMDPSEIVRVGLKMILTELKYDLRFVEYSSAAIPAPTDEGTSDVVVVTINNQQIQGFQIAQQILKETPLIRLIILTSHFSNPMLANLIQMGAMAIVTQISPAAEIQGAFRSILAGDKYLFGAESIMERKPIKLSRQELQIVDLLASGKTSKEISLALRRTSKTIETYRSRLFRKTGVKNTSQLLCFCYRNNIFCGDEVGTTTILN